MLKMYPTIMETFNQLADLVKNQKVSLPEN